MKITKIRNANIDDVPGIATVHVKMWQQAYRGQVTDSFLDTISVDKRIDKWKQIFRDSQKGIHILVSENDGIITGWIMGGTNRDKDMAPEVGELGGIYVHPDYAGKGIGSELMKTFLKILKDEGYKKATLWVLDTNAKTRKWYEAKGWKIEGGSKTEPREGFDLNEVRYIIDL